MTKREAAQVLAVLGAAYGRRLDEGQAQVWFEAVLRHVDAQRGMAAAGWFVANEEQMPSPARFRAHLRGMDARDSADRPALTQGRLVRMPAEVMTEMRAMLERQNARNL